MRATVTLADPDETVDVEVDARDRRAFERDGRKMCGLPLGTSLKEAASSAPETYVLFLAWHALTARHARSDLGPFRGFEQRVIKLDVDDAEDSEDLPDPIRAAPSAA